MLSVGRTRYSVPADLKSALRVRDGTCSFVGCSRNAEFCDIDHTIDWARDGTTSIDNGINRECIPIRRGQWGVRYL